MIGAEDVDHAAGALQFLIVVRYVEREIGWTAVAARDDAILVVVEIGRAKPDGAVLLVGRFEFGQAVDAFADLAGFVKLFFALPQIEANAETLGGALLLRDQFVAPELFEIGEPLAFRRRDPRVAVALANRFCDGDEVVAGVSVFGNGNSGSPI